MDIDPPQQDRHEPERDRAADPPPGRRRWSRSVRVAVAATSVVTAVLLVSAFLVQPFLIPSSSMDPTLQVGDRVMVNKLAYRFGNHPERGDVVVFDGRGSFVVEESHGNPVTGLLREAGAAVGLVEPSDTDYVKRVIGVGGDRVSCCDKRGRIEVNGVPVEEEYLHRGDEASAVPFDIEVPLGRLWVMGDHRSASADSRDHLGSPGGGTVPVDRVIGRVDWIGWPPSRWTSLAAGQSAAAGADGHG
ncbi:signal peptidase I [Streptomyces sp. N2-109]|uniref:Signal peptidase I n=1 Tax=Streptomyces gossypii TaxID=2883101 RepID=A0ABT2K3S5_9ACTN|nr:signal peptidase I [Streptomyces gossypii]MCT2594274.1 signal peptidase I [Streptomyces gossypii]